MIKTFTLYTWALSTQPKPSESKLYTSILLIQQSRQNWPNTGCPVNFATTKNGDQTHLSGPKSIFLNFLNISIQGETGTFEIFEKNWKLPIFFNGRKSVVKILFFSFIGWIWTIFYNFIFDHGRLCFWGREQFLHLETSRKTHFCMQD